MRWGTLAFLVLRAQLFLLIFARVTALVFTAPLISSSNIPAMARVGLALFVSAGILPWMEKVGYTIPDTGLFFAALVIGEVLIGVTLGLLLNVVYAAFQLAGQLFSLQMGFAASQVYDPLAQIQLPLIGQFLNLIAMFVLLSVSGLQKIFLVGIFRSFETVTAYNFLDRKDSIVQLMMKSMGGLFGQALLIALPIVGTLFLISVSMGLLAKAAPQMNLLMLGFPINIMVAFLILFFTLPMIMEAFGRIIDMSFSEMMKMVSAAGGGQ